MWKRAGTWAGRLCAALGLLLIVVTATPLDDWWAQRLSGRWDDPKGDTLIVLGGSMLDDGVIGLNSYWRSVYAARAYQKDGFHRIFLSGGTPDNPTSAAMKQFLICLGVPAEAITTETQSGSTRENALYAAKMLAGDHSRKVLLTSDYHMYRAVRAFRKAGLVVAPRPFSEARKRAANWRLRWEVFVDLCVESVKIVYYAARGWI
jgi:uncharacterized SAM-binding protein YcdF (DUF218 family)